MIELRLLPNVPPQAAGIAHIYSKPISIKDNVSLVDMTRDRGAAVHDFYLTQGTIEENGKTGAQVTHLSTNNLVLGNRSVLSKNVKIGARLFYRYFIGDWNALYLRDPGTVGPTITVTSTHVNVNAGPLKSYSITGKTVGEIAKEIAADFATHGLKVAVLSNTAAAFKTGVYGSFPGSIKKSSYYRVYNADTSTFDLDVAREDIKRTIEIVVDGQKNSEISWDINVFEYETNGFLVELYLDRLPEQGKTYQVKYVAIDQAGNLSNRIEIINPLPYLFEDVDYTIEPYTFPDLGWYVNPDQLSPMTTAAVIGAFGPSVTATVSSTQITINGTPYTYTGKTVREAVEEMNALFTDYTFTVLNERAALDEFSLDTGSVDIELAGRAFRLEKEYNVLYGHTNRIAALLPYDEPPTKPWYPRIANGSFTEMHPDTVLNWMPEISGPFIGKTKVTHTFTIPEYGDQVFSDRFGAPFKQLALDSPKIVSDKIIRTRRFPLEGKGSIKLRNGGEDISSIIADVDIEQGFIYLNEPVSTYPEINVEYAYKEYSVVYTGIDLNTTNDPTIVGKFVGVYVVPEVQPIYTGLTQSIYHVIRDTAEDVVADVDALTFNNGVFVHPFLAGIYQVTPTQEKKDVRYINLRTAGGGLEGSILPENEAKFLADIGRWDGEPFEADSVLVLDIPSDIIKGATDATPTTIDPIDPSGFIYPSGMFTEEDLAKYAGKWAPPGTLIILDRHDAI